MIRAFSEQYNSYLLEELKKVQKERSADAKEMTLAEIEKKLGYKVRIIAGKE